jgi:hypothetical protein
MVVYISTGFYRVVLAGEKWRYRQTRKPVPTGSERGRVTSLRQRWADRSIRDKLKVPIDERSSNTQIF